MANKAVTAAIKTIVTKSNFIIIIVKHFNGANIQKMECFKHSVHAFCLNIATNQDQ